MWSQEPPETVSEVGGMSSDTPRSDVLTYAIYSNNTTCILYKTLFAPLQFLNFCFAPPPLVQNPKYTTTNIYCIKKLIVVNASLILILGS